ncbi:hypothetical protein EMIHUDRAFT_118676 [Emiliania huxleyi CCMP1516]|uniref:S-adenosylmethionine-dependent methyltransferase domain-containing protein n=2 Tax=Emiliania huxleyi TaxID=2903 RepID=A0A0D3J0Z4_EMIH1|nr:hypothetical protein EMIHUDRAFT_118676 [Emiliania huxleyi CCMP1516]EOD17179.1 hypothetical protein EMIHUDRAFT_118676 [Emiliania huxleyi CCMP1516]|eukprot:XP_005769608.1 hypothetical protein EMIHUDRAFT_118676 [Emiliania huxleyi CCMP1516]
MLVQCRSYRLLDSGGASRLESFGDLVVRRPCPSALWQPGLPASRWDSADLVLRPEADGAWEGARANQLGEQWYMASEAGFSLGLWPGQNGQVGAFPEQGTNWRWLRSACEASPRRIRVLNLFGYTGGSSLACLASRNADVTHLDGARAAVSRARSNAELSGLSGEPVDDALTYVRRAARRGERYDGIVLDPPAFGRGGWPVAALDGQLREITRGASAVMHSGPVRQCASLTRILLNKLLL